MNSTGFAHVAATFHLNPFVDQIVHGASSSHHSLWFLEKNAITCQLKLKKCRSSPQKKTWNLVYLATIPPNPIVVQSLSPFLPMMFSWPSTQPKHPSKTSAIPAQAHCKWSRRSWYSRCKSLPSHCGLRAVALVKCIGIPIYPHPLANWWFQPLWKI